MQQYEYLIRQLDSVSTLSASGYFTVDRSLITAILSTTVTYVILLVQEKQGLKGVDAG